MEMSFPVRFIATGFFSGYSVFAPGTAGTAVTLVIYCVLSPVGLLAWSVGLGVLFGVAIYASSEGERVWGKDPGYVVIDEFVGFFATLFMLAPSIGLGVAGFFLFRALDILKPPPARQSEGLPGGWGIVMDDLIVGIYGNLILRAALWIW